ncbi:MAG: SPOR domain-containing protein [Thermoanaerobaculales bacterium]|nr:SPOR domain-containing protein [Thermoanaerobaculales bacterium]
MSPTYYVIELTPRWLTILLLALAGLMVLAFVGGYGAAWSVLGGGEFAGQDSAGVAPTPTIETVVVDTQRTPAVIPSVATPIPAEPTVTPGPMPSPTPVTTATPIQPTPRVAASAPAPQDTPYWVQVLASGNIQAIEKARRRLVEAGFPNQNHKVTESRVAGGSILLKLRIGPFPDRKSAGRVMERMQQSGFPDAWVVSP